MKIVKLLPDLRAMVRFKDGFETTRKLDSADILAQFGLKPNSPIPPDYTMQMVIGNTLVVILPKTHLTRPKKRVLAECRICGRRVCAGHYDQHLRVCDKSMEEKHRDVALENAEEKDLEYKIDSLGPGYRNDGKWIWKV